MYVLYKEDLIFGARFGPQKTLHCFYMKSEFLLWKASAISL